MPKQPKAAGDNAPKKPDATPAPTGENQPKAPVSPPDEKITQEMKALSERIGGLEKKNQNLAIENATLRATIGDDQIEPDEEMPDVNIPENIVQEIANDLRGENPDQGIRKLGGVVKDTVLKAQKAQQQRNKYAEQTRQNTERFIKSIFDQKPHLKEHEKLIGSLAEVNFNRTGKPIEAIVSAVDEFERTYLPKMQSKPGPQSQPEPAETVPSGAVAETEPNKPPPAPAPAEVPEETEEGIITQRRKVLRSRVY